MQITGEVPEEVQRRAVVLSDGGNPPKAIADRLSIPLQWVHDNLAVWEAKYSKKKDSPIAKIEAALEPNDRDYTTLGKVRDLLLKGDHEGADDIIGSEARLELYKLAKHSRDEKVRLAASKELAHQAGFKPKETIEVYSHVERMNREELVALARSYFEEDELIELGETEYEQVEGDSAQADGVQGSTEGV